MNNSENDAGKLDQGSAIHEELEQIERAEKLALEEQEQVERKVRVLLKLEEWRGQLEQEERRKRLELEEQSILFEQEQRRAQFRREEQRDKLEQEERLRKLQLEERRLGRDNWFQQLNSIFRIVAVIMALFVLYILGNDFYLSFRQDIINRAVIADAIQFPTITDTLDPSITQLQVSATALAQSQYLVDSQATLIYQAPTIFAVNNTLAAQATSINSMTNVFSATPSATATITPTPTNPSTSVDSKITNQSDSSQASALNIVGGSFLTVIVFAFGCALLYLLTRPRVTENAKKSRVQRIGLIVATVVTAIATFISPAIVPLIENAGNVRTALDFGTPVPTLSSFERQNIELTDLAVTDFWATSKANQDATANAITNTAAAIELANTLTSTASNATATQNAILYETATAEAMATETANAILVQPATQEPNQTIEATSDVTEVPTEEATAEVTP